MKRHLVSALLAAIALPSAAWAQPAAAPSPSPQPSVQGQASPEAGVQTTPQAAPAPKPTKSLTVSSITDMKLYDTKGDVVGEIDHVVSDAAGRRVIVVSYGGLFGWGQSQVAVPLDIVKVQGDRLVAQELTVEQVKARPTWTRGEATDLGADQMVTVRI
jgi:sporulation protein YlmC with PRC-barrel domain